MEKKAASQLAEKLQKFYGTLDKNEQEGLSVILNLSRVEMVELGRRHSRFVGRLDVPANELKQLDSLLKEAKLVDGPEVVAIGPTITTVTITTTVASHPIITC